MNRLAFYFGEPYQRRKAAKKFIRYWYNSMEDPEFYRLEGARVKISDLGQYLGGASLFSRSKIIRITGTDEVDNDNEFSSLLRGHDFENEVVLLEANSISKRSSLYKNLSDIAETQEFSPPTKKKFPGHVNQVLGDYGLRLTGEAKKWFIQIMELDLLRVEREVQKMKLYRNESSGPLEKEDLKEIIWTRGKDVMFDFFEAAFQGEIREATSMLEKMLTKGVESSKIFYMFANEVRRNLQVKDLVSRNLSDGDIANRTGIYQWLVSKKREQLHELEADEIMEILLQLQEEDLKIKTGRTDVEDALFRLVLSLYPMTQRV